MFSHTLLLTPLCSGFAYIIAILFGITDLESVANSITGVPILEIYYQATNNKIGASCLQTLLMLCQVYASSEYRVYIPTVIWAPFKLTLSFSCPHSWRITVCVCICPWRCIPKVSQRSVSLVFNKQGNKYSGLLETSQSQGYLGLCLVLTSLTTYYKNKPSLLTWLIIS